MGVGGNFWDELEPYRHIENIDFLRNKKVAVDLSFWIIQHIKATEGKKVKKPHISIMFFRTVKLFSKFGAYPVFIVDGTPPRLKLETRILRYCKFAGIDPNDFRRPGPGVSVPRNKTFLTWVKECLELFKLLGVPFLHAKGEAEALMAQLNRENHVFACITPDSDAFLCGAEIVIRSFSCADKNSGGPMVCYYKSEIEAHLELKRNHFIAISLLVGNDYDIGGVEGIDLDSAFQFVRGCKEDDDHILDRLREIGKKNFSQVPDNMKKICDKISKKENFPNEEIISIYSCDDDDHGFSAKVSLDNVPNMEELVGFLKLHLSWDEFYIRKMTFPMISTIILRQMIGGIQNAHTRERAFKEGHQWKFDCIKTVKTEYDHELYVVQWKSADDSGTRETYENMDLVELASPDNVKKYREQEEALKKSKKPALKQSKKPASKKKKESHDPQSAQITKYFSADAVKDAINK